MPRFKYAALDAKGKPAVGEITAEDSQQAVARVRDLGYYPTNVGEVSDTPRDLRARISRGDIALAIRQLANLVAAGLPMHRSLMVLSEQTHNKNLRALIEVARAEVRGGGALSEALARFPKQFPSLAINLIRTGESTGSLSDALGRLADLMDKSLQRRAQVTSALIYPALLITVATGAVVFLIGFLVPKLSLIFQDYEASLPLPTIILMSIADAVRNGWWAGLALILLLVVAFWYNSQRAGIAWWERLLRIFPFSRSLMEKIVTTRFARTFGALLSGGVPVLEAMEIAGQGTGSSLTSYAVSSAKKEVSEGVPVANALEQVSDFLPALIHVSAVGEETGRLPELLGRLADLLDFEVDISLRRLISVLEPGIIVVMGLIVGFIVLAILLPIFNLSSIVGR